MHMRHLGYTGQAVSALGLGCMGMSDFYGPNARPDSLATLEAARAAGITVFDTGDLYGSGHNELLLGDFLAGQRRQDVFIAVKFGALRAPDGSFIGHDCRPVAVKNFLAQTLRKLRVDYIDLYQPARVDPAVPIEDTVGAIKDMIDAGYVRHLGLSEASADTLRRAQAVHPVSWLQIEYSLFSRGIEAEILPTARDLGIAISAYGVLSRGLLSGKWQGAKGREFRAGLPRFSGDALRHNLSLVEALGRVATAKGVSTAQLAIAWVLAQGPDILPLIGARRPDQLTEALGAVDMVLTADDLAAIEAAVPVGAVAGDRYDAHQMDMLDSERGKAG